MAKDDDNLRNTVRGLRFDLVIAICALLISTLAAGAAWWQARVVAAQTRVLQEQLGAQVWPYVNTSAGFTVDTVQVDITNDGLGPAILRSVVASINGVSEPNFTAIMGALLGPNLLARKPHGEKFGFGMDTAGPGGVLPARRHDSRFYASQQDLRARISSRIWTGPNANLLLRDRTGKVLAKRLQFRRSATRTSLSLNSKRHASLFHRQRDSAHEVLV